LGNFQEVTIKNGKSVIIQAKVKLAPQRASQIDHFDFVIQTSAGDTVVDPVRFFTQH
jgi:hypothetical protein